MEPMPATRQELSHSPSFGTALQDTASLEAASLASGSFWVDVQYLHELWQPFADAIHKLEGDAMTLADAFWTYQDLDTVRILCSKEI
jgi:hypothetical protein